MKMINCFIMLSFLFLNVTAKADLPLSLVSPLPSGESYRIGDRILLQIELSSLKTIDGVDFSVSLPKPTDEKTQPTWYLDPNVSIQGGRLRLIVSPLKGGTMELPGLIVSDAKTAQILEKTSPLTFTIAALNADAKPELLEIITIGAPIWVKIVFVLAGILLIAGIIYLFIFIKKRKKIIPAVIPAPIKDPAHKVALDRVDQLFKKHPYQIDSLKPLCFGLSDTIKHFYSERFGVDANEATTDELFSLLRKSGFQGSDLNDIKALFATLDKIKFTNVTHYQNFSEEEYTALKREVQKAIQRWAT